MFHAGSKAQSTFTLKLHNVKNREVTQVKIGSYVQVVATMDPGKCTVLQWLISKRAISLLIYSHKVVP